MDASPHRALGLTDAEYDLICAQLGRAPNPVELAMYSVMWSEHCSYKSSRIHLGRLPSKGPRVLMGPGENAGVVAIDDELAVAIRMESHNHPSAIEPHQGAATGVGGILRDIFTVGARPIALLDSLWMGPQDEPRSRWIFDGVVGGISAYGNAVGVPTVGGELRFGAPYAENPLVNVVAVGIARQDRLVRAIAQGEGNLVVLLGAATGRDGIGGVSLLASSGFDDAAAEKRPSVQVGDPFEEKKLIEACLALLERGIIVGIQDLGGAGITCATSETAANGGVGMELWLEEVPLREDDLAPMEILCSESQERMLAIVEPEHLDEVKAVAAAHEVHAAVIGKVIAPEAEGDFAGQGVLRARMHGEVVAEVPAHSLAEGAPRYDRPRQPPQDREQLRKEEVRLPADWRGLARQVANWPGIDPAAVYQRYDHMLFRNTVVGPGVDAALLRAAAPGVGKSNNAIALSVDGNELWSRADPRKGTVAVVAESFLNLACVGATPIAIVDCLNFGNPEHPEVMWALSEAIDGIADIASALEVPVVGGNVSLYNEAHGRDIDPTPVVATLGLRAMPSQPMPDLRCASGTLVLVDTGEPPSLTGSLAAELLGDRRGAFPSLDVMALSRLLAFLQRIVLAGTPVTAVHNLGRGGLARSLTWIAAASGQGIVADRGLIDATTLLGEHPSRVLVATLQPDSLIADATSNGLRARAIGHFAGHDVRVGALVLASNL